jgi:hypothetical protein
MKIPLINLIGVVGEKSPILGSRSPPSSSIFLFFYFSSSSLHTRSFLSSSSTFLVLSVSSFRQREQNVPTSPSAKPVFTGGGALPSATALCVVVPSQAPVLPLLTALRVPPVFTGGGALPSATALCVAVPSLAPVLPLLTALRVPPVFTGGERYLSHCAVCCCALAGPCIALAYSAAHCAAPGSG